MGGERAAIAAAASMLDWRPKTRPDSPLQTTPSRPVGALRAPPRPPLRPAAPRRGGGGRGRAAGAESRTREEGAAPPWRRRLRLARATGKASDPRLRQRLAVHQPRRGRRQTPRAAGRTPAPRTEGPGRAEATRETRKERLRAAPTTSMEGPLRRRRRSHSRTRRSRAGLFGLRFFAQAFRRSPSRQPRREREGRRPFTGRTEGGNAEGRLSAES